jgi:hypothetical protein
MPGDWVLGGCREPRNEDRHDLCRALGFGAGNEVADFVKFEICILCHEWFSKDRSGYEPNTKIIRLK